MAFTSCFVIAPIGQDGTDVRRRSDNLFRFVIAPAATAAGFSQVFRADHLDHPGSITHQVLQHLKGVDVVIADLSDQNPNVFYELAVRHLLGKPTIQLLVQGQQLPFDVAQMRTISYDLTDPEAVDICRTTITTQLRALSAAPHIWSPPWPGMAPSIINSDTYLLVITMPPEFSGLQIERVRWRQEDCVVEYGGRAEPVQVVPSGIGPSLQVIFPERFFERVRETHTLSLSLKDDKGIEWRVEPFFPFRKQLMLKPVSSRGDVVAAYEGDEE
jgi:hypothetical protein